MSNEYTVSSYLRDVLSSGTATERAVAHTALTMLERQQKQPLTDEQIRDLATPYYPDSIQFARRIEAAHGIGNAGVALPLKENGNG